MTLTYMTKRDFDENARRHAGGHWAEAADRWRYHEAALECLKRLSPPEPQSVLEMGTMGAALVQGSHTIDFSRRWKADTFSPTYMHDARVVPWPFADKRYHTFVALRVWQHLVPAQREAFLEARRIARNIIMVTPEKYPDKVADGGQAGAVSYGEYLDWNNGREPTLSIDLGSWLGRLYVWEEPALLSVR